MLSVGQATALHARVYVENCTLHRPVSAEEDKDFLQLAKYFKCTKHF